jgi:hypothetical protein
MERFKPGQFGLEGLVEAETVDAVPAQLTNDPARSQHQSGRNEKHPENSLARSMFLLDTGSSPFLEVAVIQPEPGPHYHPDYRFEMSGAHRKPAYEVGAPSITWHAGFWKPKTQPMVHKDDESNLKDKESRTSTEDEPFGESYRNHNRWIKQIEILILHVYDSFTDHQTKHKNLFVLDYPSPDLTNLQPVTPPHTDELHLLRNIYPKENRTGSCSYVSMGPIGCETYDHAKTESLDHPPRPTRYETVHIDGVWNSMPIDIRFEVNSEYFTISATVDFSRMRPNPPGVKPRRRRLRKPDDEFQWIVPEYRVASNAMYKVIEQVNSRRKSISSAAAIRKKDDDIAQLRRFTNYLFKTFWEKLKQEIVFGVKYTAYLDAQNWKLEEGSNKEPTIEDYLGECFADFRNLTLQCIDSGNRVRNPWRQEQVHPDRNGIGAQEKMRSKAQKTASELLLHFDPALIPENGIKLIPEHWPETTLRKSIEGHFFKEDNLDWVDSIQPILLSLEPDEINDLAADPVEYTFSRFFHDRCIYGSGFGPQVDDLKPNSGDPLTYLLLFGYDEHRQMGRLLQRVNTLGTVRIAAIHDLPDIKHVVDHTLVDIEKQLRNLQREIYKKIDSPGKSSSGKPASRKTSLENPWKDRSKLGKERRKRVDALFAEIHVSLASLDSPDPFRGEGEDDLARSVKNGTLVPYRAARSKYYLDRFEKLTRTLDIEPVLGFNPYNDFVQLRLGRAFSIFQVVAEHFEILREKESRLRREWMTFRSEHHQTEIESLQRSAEVFFFLILFPYYVSSTLNHALEPGSKFFAGAESFLSAALPHWVYANVHPRVLAAIVDFLPWLAVRLGRLLYSMHDDPSLVVFLSFTFGLLILVGFRPHVVKDFLKDLPYWRKAIDFFRNLLQSGETGS